MDLMKQDSMINEKVANSYREEEKAMTSQNVNEFMTAECKTAAGK